MADKKTVLIGESQVKVNLIKTNADDGSPSICFAIDSKFRDADFEFGYKDTETRDEVFNDLDAEKVEIVVTNCLGVLGIDLSDVY